MFEREVFVKGGCALSLLASSLLCGGCSPEDPRSQAEIVAGGPVGAVSVDLQREDGADVEQLHYMVTRGPSELRSGMIAVSGDTTPVRAVIDRLPAGPVDVAFSGVARNGFWCRGGSATTVAQGRMSALAIWLRCAAPGGGHAGASGGGACEAGAGAGGSAGDGDGDGDGAGGKAGGGAGASGSAGEDAGAGGAGAGGSAGEDAGAGSGGAGAGGSAGADSGAGGSAGEDGGVDAGTDAGGGDAGGEPSACDAPADDCAGCVCASCAEQFDACEHAQGVAQAGPAAGTSLSTLCLDVVDCSRTSGCTGLECYCGPGVGLGMCLGGGAFGACEDEMVAAAETTVPTLLVPRQGDSSFALGLATAVMTCSAAECAADCD